MSGRGERVRELRPAMLLLVPDRRARVVALTDAALDDLLAQLSALLESESQLDALVERSLSVFVDFASEHRRDHPLFMGELPRRVVELYLPALRSAPATRDLRQQPQAENRLSAYALIALCEAVVQAWLADPAPLARYELIELVKDMVMAAMQA
jgi:hypothetical protein